MKNSKKVKSAANEANNNEKTQDQDKLSVMQPKQKELLRYIFNQIFTSQIIVCLKDPLSEGTSDQSANTIGLDGIKKKFDDNNYTRFEEFIDDIDKLVQRYTSHPSTKAKVREVAQSLKEKCQADVKSIKACCDCFEFWMNNNDDYFTRVCTTPHLLVYVNVERRLWPAKLMLVDGDKAQVEFFGEHTQDDVDFSKCFLYSDEIFSKSSTKNAALCKANKELQLHIEEIKKCYGSFHPAVGEVALENLGWETQRLKMFSCTKSSNDSGESGQRQVYEKPTAQGDVADVNLDESMVQENIDNVDASMSDDLVSLTEVSLKLTPDAVAAEEQPSDKQITDESTYFEEFEPLHWSGESCSDESRSEEEMANGNKTKATNGSTKGTAEVEELDANRDDEPKQKDEKDEPSIVAIEMPKKTSHVTVAQSTPKATELKGRASPFVQENFLNESLPEDTSDLLSSNNETNQQMKGEIHEEEIPNLERDANIKPTCATCKIVLDGPFFCSEKCKNNQE